MNLRQGDIWLINLEPSHRGELGNRRPCVIVSNNVYNASTSVPLVMPIASYPPTVRSPQILATPQSGLSNDSSLLPLHVRAIARSRFIHRLGRAPQSLLQDATEILILVLSQERHRFSG
jgi:mRNA interferase MazF